MFLLNKMEHALVTVFGDSPEQVIAKLITLYIPDKELKILTPYTPQNLEQAAQNSVLVFIGVENAQDPNLQVARMLKENRLISCDVIAYCLGDFETESVGILAKGFDLCVTSREANIPDFKKFLYQKIIIGGRRLSGLIMEEEYHRVCDALSAAPASMIIFDVDKRAVFISDHYFRAYPRIAPRLVRGLSVYDAFDMMAKEEGIGPEDPLYESLQRFWYNLNDSIEFQLKSGVSYRLKAVQLPGRRGVVLMGQNVSGYVDKHASLEDQAMRLREELEKISGEIKASAA